MKGMSMMNGIRGICVPLCPSVFRSQCLRLGVSAMLFVAAVSAQRIGPGWAWQNPLPQGNQLNSIHFAKDKLTGFAVGADNSILYTRNGGFTWQHQMTMENVSFSSVFTKDSKNAVVVGARGTILLTDNGGDFWRAVPIGVRDHLAAVTFVEGNQTGWAV